MENIISNVGLVGYAANITRGIDGSNGHSVYYSSFKSDASINIIGCINRSKALSDNISHQEKCQYNVDDLIIFSDSSVGIITKVSSNDSSYLIIGGMLYYNINKEVSEKTNDIQSIAYTLDSSYIADNNYNNNVLSATKHKLHRHRSAWSKCFGNKIKLSSDSYTDLSTILTNSNYVKFCIVFNSGLLYEKILTSDNYKNEIFIDNRYFYPFGSEYKKTTDETLDTYTINSSVWTNTKALENFADEENSSIMTTKFFTATDSSVYTHLLRGYIEYCKNNKTYRVKVSFKN